MSTSRLSRQAIAQEIGVQELALSVPSDAPAAAAAATLGDDHSEIRSEGTSVIAVPGLLGAPECQSVLDHLVSAQRAWKAAGREALDPTVHHGHGLVHCDAGMQPWCEGLLASHGIAGKVLERFGVVLDTTDFLAFWLHFPHQAADAAQDASDPVTAEQTPWHVDESMITVNICLSAAEDGAGSTCIEFQDGGGHVCHTAMPAPGDAIIHPGALPHRAVGCQARDQLVFYCVSREKAAAAAEKPHAPIHFFDAYVAYLQQKHATGPVAFDPPMMPQHLRLAAEKLAGVTRSTTKSEQEAFSRPGLAVAAEPRRLQLADVDDVVSEVATFCPTASQIAMRAVCRSWQQIVDDVRDQSKHARWEAARVALSASKFGGSTGSSEAIITIGAGGTGIAGAGHFLERLCATCGVSPSGTHPGEACSKVFIENAKGTVHARSVFVDTADALAWPGSEFSSAETLSSVPPVARWSDVIGNDNIVSGSDECGRLYPLAYHCQPVVESSSEALRKQLEAANRWPAVLGFRSIAGASGAVLDAMLEIGEVASMRGTRADVITFPDPTRDHYANVGAYNSVLSLAKIINHRDLTFLVGNSELHKAVEHAAGGRGRRYDPYTHAEVTARGMSGVVSSMLTDGALNTSFSELQTNVIPFPSVHFASLAVAPLVTKKHFLHRGICERLSPMELVNEVVCSNHSLLSPGACRGKLMSYGLHFHGDWVPKDVMAAVATIKTKRTLDFVDWAPCGFKCGISHDPLRSGPSGILQPSNDRDVTAIFHGTGLAVGFSQVLHSFERNYSKRAFVHHFVAAGAEEGEFLEGVEALRCVEKDYEEVAAETLDEDYVDDEY